MKASFSRGASLALAAGMLTATFAAVPVAAQEYPAHEIHAVCSYAA